MIITDYCMIITFWHIEEGMLKNDPLWLSNMLGRLDVPLIPQNTVVGLNYNRAH